MTHVDLKRCPIGTARGDKIVQQVQAVLDYMAAAGKAPESVRLYPGHYDHLLRTLNRRLRKEAEWKAREENERRKLAGVKERVEREPAKVSGLSYGGVPVVRGAPYSRHRVQRGLRP